MAYIERLQREQGILSNFQYGAFDVPPSSALGASVSDESLTSALDHEEDDSRHGPIVFPLQGKVPDEQPPRMRFAPSPTGSLHVGGARTALYNWLVARKGQAEEPQSNAAFVLRVEDTDLARSTKESENSVLADLEWLGLLWDEGPDMPSETAPYGPYRQSERGEVYYAVAQKLMDDGKAYRCFCTPEELDAMKADQEARGETPRYDGRWRDASVDDVQQALDEGKAYTVRFKVTDNSRVVIDDVVRGLVSWDAQATVGDFILLRSSGVPVYNFCVAVDDACMGITTVVRAEEHLTNTVRQALVLDALGAPRPRYAHCSLILGEDKQKLSKRHGATSCDQYRLDGFLPDAMINYLALLGWNDGTDNEIFARDELIDAFELDRVVKSPSVFDLEKLKWVNAQHLKLRTVEDLVPLVKQQILWHGMFKDGLVSDDSVDLGVIDFTYAATALAKQMMETTKDAALNAKTVLGYGLPATFTDVRDEEARTMIATGNFYALAQKLVAQYRSGEFPRPDESNPLAAFQDAEGRMIEEDTQKGPACQFTQDYMAHMKSLAKELGLKGRHLFHPVRLALTGEMSGQDVTKQMSLLALATKADSVIDSQYVVDMETRMTRLEAFCESIPDEYRAPRTVAKKESESVVGPTAAATTATTVESPGTDSYTVDPKDAYTGPPISALDIRVGRVMKVWEHPEADKLYCEEIDVGEDEPRQIASGLRPYLQPEDIDGRLVLVLCNLKERKLVGFASHGMVLCASNADHSEVRLVNPPVDARIGERVSIPDFDFTSEEGAPFAENKVGKKKIVEQLAPYLVTNRYGVPEFLGRPFVTSAGVCTTSIPDGTVS
jgi:glutamyl-tRNA synthetase